jgi:hypothetical protein
MSNFDKYNVDKINCPLMNRLRPYCKNVKISYYLHEKIMFIVMNIETGFDNSIVQVSYCDTKKISICANFGTTLQKINISLVDLCRISYIITNDEGTKYSLEYNVLDPTELGLFLNDIVFHYMVNSPKIFKMYKNDLTKIKLLINDIICNILSVV